MEKKTITSKIPEEEIEKIDEKVDSRSRWVCELIKAWNDVEEEHGIDEDFKLMNLAVLKTYRNALDKNIQVMEAKRDKLQTKIDDIEEDKSEEILFTVEFNFEGQKL